MSLKVSIPQLNLCVDDLIDKHFNSPQELQRRSTRKKKKRVKPTKEEAKEKDMGIVLSVSEHAEESKEEQEINERYVLRLTYIQFLVNLMLVEAQRHNCHFIERWSHLNTRDESNL